MMMTMTMTLTTLRIMLMMMTMLELSRQGPPQLAPEEALGHPRGSRDLLPAAQPSRAGDHRELGQGDSRQQSPVSVLPTHPSTPGPPPAQHRVLHRDGGSLRRLLRDRGPGGLL